MNMARSRKEMPMKRKASSFNMADMPRKTVVLSMVIITQNRKCWGGRCRNGRFRSKLGQIGPQIGQIRDFFRSDFSTFSSSSQMF